MFNDRIRKLRNDKGLSQRELAKMLKISPSTIAMYELGKREPDIAMFQRLADFFNVPVEYVMGVSDEPKPWWEKDEEPTDIELEEFIKNNSNIKLMGDPLDEKAKDDVLMFLRAAHQMIKEKRKAEEEVGKE
ncbi:Helix-turn-helix domain protein [Tepidanaerobacter acetatoxydans Re1]|uniref:Helix-turn-helix domain protein n=1 Tax=Tepidanaerobacter acetatoxydans (strain DSM 21804 / JCM 16047 / Re1) TaxID=1209989 RepID=F4LRV1_TEPAE|nr:helix-turn-helix transcriptional regulator [Tepidanaerobacter acetatoxydans]AEE91169.1 helix-turn-helix domain protein [Tepidanaerobacter acetatoxydans Re1]CCP25840.1 Helix-turn-helix domain protein [Tepidanaerobacter acetatoxydans Re1]